MNTAMKKITQVFWLPRTCNSYVYTVPVKLCGCATALSKKIIYFNIKYFIAKKCKQSSKPSANHNFCWWRILPQCWWLLTGSRWWLVKVEIAAAILKMRQQWSLQHQLTLFMNSFFCSMPGFLTAHLQKNTVQTGINSLKPTTALWAKIKQ